MTLELFSSLLEEFISKNDTISVTGLGVFRASIQAASISDNGFTINPPYRKLEFKSIQNPEEGTAFEKLLAAKYKISIEEAKRETEEICSLILNSLQEEQVVELPNFGKFRSLDNGEVFFIMDMDADIYPEGFGLERVSLKNKNVKSILQPINKVIPAQIEGGDTDTVVEQVEEPKEEMEEAEDSKEQKAVEEKESVEEKKKELAEKDKKKKQKKGGKVFWRLLWALIILAVVLLCAFLLLSRFYPELLDKILYSPEELELIKSLGI
ncbi:MAG: hypothetical protein ACI3ZF_00855 [Candidatus Cryptobacteroides sp.]